MSGSVGNVDLDALNDELGSSFYSEGTESKTFLTLSLINNEVSNPLKLNALNETVYPAVHIVKENSTLKTITTTSVIENNRKNVETTLNFLNEADTLIKEILGDENEELEKPFTETELLKLLNVKSNKVKMESSQLKQILIDTLHDSDYRKLVRLKWKVKSLSRELKIYSKAKSQQFPGLEEGESGREAAEPQPQVSKREAYGSIRKVYEAGKGKTRVHQPNIGTTNVHLMIRSTETRILIQNLDYQEGHVRRKVVKRLKKKIPKQDVTVLENVQEKRLTTSEQISKRKTPEEEFMEIVHPD